MKAADGKENKRSASIGLTVNGEARSAPASTSVAGLLDALGIPPLRVAVEHNRRILKRVEFPDVVLADGDRLEIVHFVGGG